MDKGLISIIIPTYNEETLLPRLLKSIKRQKGVQYEIIIADNNSTDKTKEIARSYGAKIVLGGLPAQARNNGAKEANGEILIFLDADVVLPAKDFLKYCVSELKDRNLQIATCVVRPISEKIIDKALHQAVTLFIKATCKIVPHMPGCCIIIYKSAHQKIHGFNEELRMAEDHDYAQRASQIGKFGILKSYPIFVSVRRLENDGRVKIAVKYVLCEAYMQLIGPVKSDIFKYQFGHNKKAEF